MNPQMNVDAPLELVIPEQFVPQSLERYLAAQLQIDYLLARSWIREAYVLVDGAPGKASRYLKAGQRLSVTPPPPKPHPAEPEALDLPIVYADADLVVVNKPAGMASHPGPGWWRGSCVNALLYLLNWPGINGVAGPGIVHRLDRDTSGLMVFARSQSAHQALLTAMQQRLIKREYLAWVSGCISGSGSINARLGRDPKAPERVIVKVDGQTALTHYQVLQSRSERSLVKLKLETGRTHQIRVHLQHLGHPIIGDPVYGLNPDPDLNDQAEIGLALHAYRLSLKHPVSAETLCFETFPTHWGPFTPDSTRGLTVH